MDMSISEKEKKSDGCHAIGDLSPHSWHQSETAWRQSFITF